MTKEIKLDYPGLGASQITGLTFRVVLRVFITKIDVFFAAVREPHK